MRRKARELAFKVLFEHAVGGVSLEEAWEHVSQSQELEEGNSSTEGYDDLLDQGGLEFARRLLEGYQHREAEVDKVLGSTIQGWSFGQMAKTDLAVLRLAAYEMLFEPTPYAPLIEVAVKIAKRYGGEDSGRFVNGVLGRLLKRIESGEIQAVEKEK
ncbi:MULTISPECIES: transcription antitermination factor NusB [unclassified Meiothermus]|uniref:transcription antitermination factor NusB n=1 Tax=unclassified Meiothermus TaxID=370471 RepID=UPI000D7BBA31|nr:MULTISPECIES: transcription antitermination factor NusB [unclassified Meiothermus]PZA08081.1 transcription antitermination factor NusB [Meiothermus sp. Pnk-1]RYM38799.1 transcription antitermination factor NusB [Meiothermus sp. PNK-Is4]